MKNIIYLFLIIIAIVFSPLIRAQQISIDSIQHPDRFISKNLPMLTDKELMKIASMPDLPLPSDYALRSKAGLPYKVDNSTQPYMIDITWQNGYECGQSASIAFVFTYEINRLRHLPSNTPDNKYVTHFAWNFLNNGYNYTGVSYYDSWEVVRYCGTPNITEYGGSMWTGGEKRWMTGYNLYYSAMKNRLFTGYNIQVGTPEGLMVLKNWIANHLDGSAVGGLANFYAQYGGPNTTLPAGTEEGGKALMSTWGGSPSHTWTIVGYNDSIRYDYNSDGLYTNHVDINSDGLIDMHDWEIGGLKFANGYSGTGWGNNGYSYMMYKCLADNIGSGGIWNNRVSIQYPKQTHSPLLTMKVQMKHNSRNKIKVMAGVSTNIADTKPQYTLELPIFNFQGGDFFMQGDTTEAAKTIEFGIDVSRLLNYIAPGQNAKYFLQVIEKDPSGQYTGEIINYTLMDYTSGLVQTVCPNTNVPITNNDTTRLSVTRAVNFSNVSITTNTLPSATINQPYSFTLAAAQGATSYHWDFDHTFTVANTNPTFPSTSAITLSAGSSGYAVQNLAFEFPFYGEKISKLYISPDGFIKFDNQLYNWPYLIDKTLLFKSTKMIAPYFADLSFGAGDGFWFEGNSQEATIRWKAYVSGQSGSYVNVAVKLYKSGLIEFYYGNISVSNTTSFINAVSRGDNRNFYFTPYSGKLFANTLTKGLTLTPPQLPEGLQLSDDGILSGELNEELNAIPLKICVIDNNDIINKKTIPFSTRGIIAEYSVYAGTDSIVNAGENILLSIGLKNIDNVVFTNGNMKIKSSDSHVIITDSTELVGNVAANDSVIFLNAFAVTIDSLVPDNYNIPITLRVYNTVDTFTFPVVINVRSIMLDIGRITILDGNNNIPEPGENIVILTQVKNLSTIKAIEVNALCATNDAYANISTDSAYFNYINGLDSTSGYYIVQLAPNVPDGHIMLFDVNLKAAGGYSVHKFFAIQIGGNAEDFETNDFSQFPWISNGDSLWFTTNQSPYEGAYCSESGNIAENQNSSLMVELNIINNGTLSFYRKVSCEGHPGVTDYDYLSFSIDNVEMARWDGVTQWQRFEYPVSAGLHTFKWIYSKDFSVSSGEDCAWLDYIVFPPSFGTTSNTQQSPSAFNKDLVIDSITVDSIQIQNLTPGGTLIYSCEITDYSSNGNQSWLQPEVYFGSLDGASSGTLLLYFNSYGLAVDTYNATIKLTYNFVDTVTIPVALHVYSTTDVPEQTNNPYRLIIYPNPFAEKISFSFYAKGEAAISLEIFDISGRKIKTILQNEPMQGSQQIFWDATNDNFSPCSRGVYFYKFTANETTYNGSLIYTK